MTAFRIFALFLFLLAGMFAPFVPGEYDAVAVILSSVIQISAFATAVLLPIGVVWLVFGRADRRGVRLLCAILASVVIITAVTLGATLNNSFAFSALLLVLGILLSIALCRRVARGERFAPAVPLFLIIVPAALVIARIAFIVTAVDYSRNLAIENSRPMIDSIEAYHQRNGNYPVSLHSLYGDYDPGVVGVRRYYYEPSGKAYNLFFEQFSDEIGTNEFVMYNKLGEQNFSAHDADLLEFSPADILLQRGYHRSKSWPQTGWKSFFFD